MSVSPLAELIALAQDEFLRKTGVALTQGDIARRSGLSRQRVSQLVTERPKTLIPHDTVERLAKGLRVSYDQVLAAALESAGYEVPDRLPIAARRGRTAKELGQDEQSI